MNNTAATVAAFRNGTRRRRTPVAPTAPTAPSGLAASATAYNSVTVRWADNSGDESGFKVERSGNGVDFTEVATLGAATTSFVDNGVVASSNYYYRVRAFNSVGNSAYSNTGSRHDAGRAGAGPGNASGTGQRQREERCRRIGHRHLGRCLDE